MARISGELVINRPVTEVFDFVADERNEPRYNPGIRQAEKLSPGPIGRGDTVPGRGRHRAPDVRDDDQVHGL